MKKGKKLLFYSDVGAFAVCFNKGFGSPSLKQTGLFVERADPKGSMDISADLINGQQFAYSICLFRAGKEPLCKDPTIIIT